MKKIISFLCVASVWLCLCHCGQGSNAAITIKDLGENMMDLRIYQENLGDEIRAGRLQDAVWLLEGMDSILLMLGKKFTEHRKLQDGFSYYYKKEMKEPVRMMRNAIKRNDTSEAIKGYKLLVKNCNSCHINHDIDKTVRE